MAMDPELTVAWRQVDQVSVVEVAGEVDLHSGQQLAEELEELLDQGKDKIAVDLARVTYLDSSGLKILLNAQQRAAGCGGGLVLVGTSDRALKVVKLTGLANQLPTFQTVDEASSALGGGA